MTLTLDPRVAPQHRERALAAAERIERWLGFEFVQKETTPAARDWLVALVAGQHDDTSSTWVTVYPGAVLWNNNLDPCEVLYVSHVEPDFRARGGIAVWWETTAGLFDSTRLATFHPGTQARAAV